MEDLLQGSMVVYILIELHYGTYLMAAGCWQITQTSILYQLPVKVTTWLRSKVKYGVMTAGCINRHLDKLV